MATPFRVKAVYDYASPHEDDLNFNIGQVITVNDQEDDDWYGGEYVDDAGTKHEGIFPRNFVEKFEPTAPPRPTRTRTKKESEPEPEAPQSIEKTEPTPISPPVSAAIVDEPSATQDADDPDIDAAQEQKSPPAAAPPPQFPPREIVHSPEAAPISPPAAPKTTEPAPPAAASAPQAAKPKPKGPPPVSEKPTSNSFKDRIAAFNKPAAPPVAPFKPGGLSGGSGGGAPGFVKKPFVAAPPSRNAYVPPPREAPTTKVYRREEDPEVKETEAQVQEQAERAGFSPSSPQGEDEEDQPKPTSLKERIALLQKQQMEQAARQADTAAKKEKPKKPVKKPADPALATEAIEAETAAPAQLERKQTTESIPSRPSTDDQSARVPPRRKSSIRPMPEGPHDGNEADMSGAGDTTEGQDEGTEREESDEITRTASRAPTGNLTSQQETRKEEEREDDDDEDEEEEEEDEDVDPEVKRKEELRARMAKMSGGMGFHGMFGAPMPAPGPAPPKKKKSKPDPAPVEEEEEEAEDVSTAQRSAPPIPTAMALPGMGGPRKSLDEPIEDDAPPLIRAPPPPPRQTQLATEDEDDDEEEDNDLTPAPTATAPLVPPRDPAGPPPPVPGGRPAPPPVPSEARPAPPGPEAESPSEGSESDDELSGAAPEKLAESTHSDNVKSPPPPAPQSPDVYTRSPPLSPQFEAAPTSTAAKRSSRPPPPIPGAVAPPVPSQSRPPPPPPPGGLSRQTTSDLSVATPSRPPQAGEEHEDEATEYEGDYDTDIASSVPHKDALKAHARDSSLEDNTLQSPVADAPPSFPPPVPANPPPARAAPPPLPSQPPPESKRRSVDVPRAAPPPPPPAKEVPKQEEYDPYNYASPSGGPPSAYAHKTPRIEEEAYFPSVQSPGGRAPPPPPAQSGRTRQSMDVPRTSMAGKRSSDMPRPSMAMESGFIANDLDLGVQSGWWKQSNQVPPVLQGRRDIYFETEESTTNNQGAKTIVTRTVRVLFQDYSQTTITVLYDPYDPSDVELDQNHEPPPRALRQDQMEEYYERFGRHISESVSAKKDSVVADGSPQGLIYELLKPYRDVLPPVGSRAYGALVYSNMANASTQQHDVIRAGDIISIRNAKFQGKHGAMHAKYTAEVGKPDHVAVVSEWDGTKKKVRAWEQGRESKKVKVESFKLDDLRSGEVKIWRVMPRSWVGWSSQS